MFDSKKNKAFKPPLKLTQLNPIIVDDVTRVDGHLKETPVPHNSKYPVMLSQNSHVTKLTIRHHHELVGHSGVGHMWSSITLRY